MKRKRNRVLCALLLLALLTGCSKKEENTPVQGPAKKPQAAKPAQQPGAPVQKQVSSAGAAPARLDFSKRRDPFKSLMPAPATPPPGQTPAAQEAQRPTADMLPIQSFEVAKFRLVGIVAGLNRNKALVIDPTGKGYVVQEGMQIGSNQGRISRITSSTVEVVEPVREGGRNKVRKIVLTLAKKR